MGVGIGAGIAALTASGMDRIDELADTSQRIGVTTEALAQLRHGANLTGSASEDLDKALLKMNENLGNVNGGPASDALSRIGLDMKDLRNQSPDEAFKKIVGGFEGLGNAAEKSKLAVEIFGGDGIKILNTLSAGGDQLNALATEANAFGLAVSGVDASKIGEAKDAMDRAGSAIEGIGNTLAIELSPFITVVAGQFSDWTSTTVTGGNLVTQTLEQVASVIGTIGDFGFNAEKGTQELFASIIEGSGSVLDFFGGDGSGAKDIAKTFREDISRAFDVKPSTRITDYLETIKTKAAEVTTELAKPVQFDSLGDAIEKVTKKLEDQIATFGKTTAEVEIYKLAQAGASSEQLASVQALSDKLKDLGTKTDTKAVTEKTGPEAGTFAGAQSFGSAEARSTVLAAVQGKPDDSSKKIEKNTFESSVALKQIAKSLSKSPEEMRI